MRVKQSLKLALAYAGLIDPVTDLWRMLTPKGRQLNARLARRTQRIMTMYAQFVSHGDLCFDIGANHGEYTDVLLKLGARVVSVEPQPACLKILHARYYLRKDVHIVGAGLAEVEGEHEFLISANDNISTMSPEWTVALKSRGGKFAQADWSTKVVVPVTTLDNLIKQYGLPAFCKIDVEGFEYHVLKGLSQHIQALSFEYTGEFIQTAIDCVTYLASLARYEFNYGEEDTLSLTLSEWIGPEAIISALQSLALKHHSGDVYARVIAS